MVEERPETTPEEYWNHPDQIERFGTRPPDERLIALLRDYTQPGALRVLDLGCAGGRNTELLVRSGFDVVAVDAARGMVEKTRERVRRVFSGLEGRAMEGEGGKAGETAGPAFSLSELVDRIPEARMDEDLRRILDSESTSLEEYQQWALNH